MLRALGKLLAPGGRLAFFTIHLPRGLSPEERKRARAVGPTVSSRGDYETMLRHAGLDVVVARDATPAFLDTARAWFEEAGAHAAELAGLAPEGLFEQQQEERRLMVDTIEQGLLRRSLFVATRRGRRAHRRSVANLTGRSSD